VISEAGAGTGDQGGVARPPRGLNLSPRTVDAQVRLRSGSDNRGTFTPRTLDNGSRKTTAGPANKEHILTEYRSIVAGPKVAQIGQLSSTSSLLTS
jgi:hypothetical protein